MNRATLQQLADQRVADAGALLAASCLAGGYYLAGYALECALKACILRFVEATGAIFRDKKFLEGCWTHKLEILLKTADLERELGLAIQADQQLGRNWNIAKDWTEESRYELKAEAEARELYTAITDPQHGVLTWTKTRW